MPVVAKTNEKDVARKFQKMINAATPKQLEIAVKVGLQPITNAAKQKAPVLSGNLQRSITDEVRVQGSAVEGRTGTNVVYAAIQEFGGETGNGGFIAPQPYLRPAFFEQKQSAINEIVEVLQGQIRKSAR